MSFTNMISGYLRVIDVKFDLRKIIAGKKARRICAAVLTLAIFLSGFGIGHAAPAAPADGMHHGHAASVETVKCEHSETRDHTECHGQTTPSDKRPLSMQHETGGCCVNVCFPTVMPRDVLTFTPPAFVIQKVIASIDRTPALASPKGPFRPPRDSA
ncbi:MAG: hypothetical protein RIA64_17460 [Rhodospirillales bacterium]